MKKGERTRLTIIHTSARLFERQGYFSTGIDDIAHTLHIAKGTMYQYFKDKRELFQVIVEDAVEEINSRYSKLNETTDNLRDLVAGLIYEINLFNIREYDFFTIQLSAGSSLWTTVESSYTPMRILTAKIEEMLCVYGEEIATDIGEAAVTLTMIINACRVYLMEMLEMPRDEITDEQIRTAAVKFANRFLDGYGKSR